MIRWLCVTCLLCFVDPSTHLVAPSGPAQSEGTSAESIDPANVRAVIDEVMSAPDYRHLIRPKKDEPSVPGWLDRLLDWLTTKGEQPLAALSWSAILVRVLVLATAVIVLLIIAVVIVRGVLNRSPDLKLNLAHGPNDAGLLLTPPGDLPADEYVRRATELARAGDPKGAIRELLLGAMSWIERAGLIRFRRGLSNRDYLRAVRRRQECHESMNAIIDAFDRTYFGRRVATAEMFDWCLEQYRRGFATNETVAMAR
jgi:hypothetical protein